MAYRKRTYGRRKTRTMRPRRRRTYNANRRRRPTKKKNPMLRKKAITKLVKREIDKDQPDTVITTYKRTEYNSGIGAGDVGYIWKDVDEVNLGGLAVVRRMSAIKAQPVASPTSRFVGSGLKCRSLYYHGSFHVNPSVFGDGVGIQNNQVRVHCWVLSDKYNPNGNAESDRNCVEDLLIQRNQLWPNNGNGYLPAQAQPMMIPYAGTILDEDLFVNRDRFKVHHHKMWDIVPTSAVLDSIDGIPNVSSSGRFHRKFRMKIPCPKIAKWDRRVQSLTADNANVQTPKNCGDPFVIWGYCPYPQEEGPDFVLTNLVVESYVTLRCEPEFSPAN